MLIKIPKMGANDEKVLLVQWMVADNAKVGKGQSIVALETSKASVELEVEGKGILKIIEQEGHEYPVGHIIGEVKS